VPEADFASFASTFVRLAAGITRADVGITAPDASGCGSGHHTLLAGVCLMTPIPTASLTSATSPSAIWLETRDAQCDELHCWRFLFQLVGRSVPKSDRGTLPRSRYSSLAPSSGVTRGGKAKRPSRFLELSLCTPSVRSDTSSYLSLFCSSC